MDQDALKAADKLKVSFEKFLEESAPSLGPNKRSLLANELFRVVDRWSQLQEPEASNFLNGSVQVVLANLGLEKRRVDVKVLSTASGAGISEASVRDGAAVYATRLRNTASKILELKLPGSDPNARSGIQSVRRNERGYLIVLYVEAARLTPRLLRNAIARTKRRGAIKIAEVAALSGQR